VHGQGRNPLAASRRPHPRSLLALAIGCACAIAFAVTPARAQQLEIRVDTPAVTLVPTPADYNQDYVDAVGSSGIQLKVRAQGLLGCHVFVRCSDPAPQIRLNDLLVRTPSAPGIGGTTISAFTPVTAVDQPLWSSTVSAPGFSTQLICELRVRNLMTYDDAPGAITTSYQNTLTFTVISP